tara:strand:+ start:1725 stop:2051 length:327 start_codon:yes stop_codon:yes gene_type:complete
MDIENNLQYLAKTDEPYAEKDALLDFQIDNLKNVKGSWIGATAAEKPKISMGLLTEQFYSTGSYFTEISKIKELRKEVNTMKNKRATAILRIDVWRTLEASRRKGNIQ